MSQVVKGMIQVQGTTYRIVRIKRGYYNVVRVLDDVAVGTFTAGAAAEITAAAGIDPTVMRQRGPSETGANRRGRTTARKENLG